MTQPRFVEQDRRPRRAQTGIGTGAFVGGALALGVAILTGAFAGLGLVGLTAAGIVVGALVGWLLVTRISADEWEPTDSAKPFVGAHTPDDDGSAVVTRR